MDHPRYQRSTPEIIGELFAQLPTLARKESQLARAEVSDKIGQVGFGLTFVVCGAVLSITLHEVLPVKHPKATGSSESTSIQGLNSRGLCALAGARAGYQSTCFAVAPGKWNRVRAENPFSGAHAGKIGAA